jgi:hypothetical protein
MGKSCAAEDAQHEKQKTKQSLETIHEGLMLLKILATVTVKLGGDTVSNLQ